MTTITTAPLTSWTEPEGIPPRGTVIVLVGRGETAAVYGRLGRRLATDAYRVVVLDQDIGAGMEQVLPEAVRPVIVLGSDEGALEAVRVGAGGGVDAVIVAGLPVSDQVQGDDLELRTACPNHRRVLTASALPLANVVLPNLSSRLGSLRAPQVPLLAIHGAADEVSTPTDAVARYQGLGASKILVVRGGRHDILNDVSHRSVAASIVLFLEEVRDGGGKIVVAVSGTPS